jgi:hypothetical protein
MDSQSASAGETPTSLTTKDNRLSDPDPPILEVIPYKETPTVTKLLDRIWTSLLPRPRPNSYGREWILYGQGEYFHKIGTRWAQFVERKLLDERPLREVGIVPDMILEVRRPKQRMVVINQRPLVGGGEEPLLLVGLKTVGELLNKIQDSIPDLSVKSYGTKWILYDPAKPDRHFDDIVKRRSRVLDDVGIATEDGDTFLHVRPPNVEEPTTPKIQLGCAVGFGIVGLAVILLIAIFIPVPTEFQYQVFRIILALAAGGAASMIPGILNLQISNFITAGGALAVFVVVHFYSPAQLALRGIAPNPTPTPPIVSPAASVELENWRNRWQTWRNLNYKAELRNQRLDPNLPPRIYIETLSGKPTPDDEEIKKKLHDEGFDASYESIGGGSIKTTKVSYYAKYPDDEKIQPGAGTCGTALGTTRPRSATSRPCWYTRAGRSSSSESKQSTSA